MPELNAQNKASLEGAMEIGRVFNEQKEKLLHGEYGRWLNKTGFTRQTADNYRDLGQYREQLKMLNVGNLAAAYKAIRKLKSEQKKLGPVTTNKPEPAEEYHQELKTFARFWDGYWARFSREVRKEFPAEMMPAMAVSPVTVSRTAPRQFQGIGCEHVTKKK